MDCDLSKEEVKFLGHISDKGGQPDPAKTEAAKEKVKPSKISELQSLKNGEPTGKVQPSVSRK